MSLITVTQVKCSACGRQYQQQVHQAIDAGKEPQLKNMLLSGRFNVSACPQCGNQGILSLPFLYHDADKSLFLVLQPMDLRGGPMSNQQQVIGALSSQFMASLKPEERRGYMLQPKIYLSLQSMIDDIMVADGITREEIQAARERTALIDELAQAATLDDLKQKVEQNKEKIDRTFFEVLAGYIQQAAESGDRESAQALSDLRDDLLSLTDVEGVDGGKPLEVDREALLKALMDERDPERVRQLVAVARPALDYFFFQMLADRIEAAGAEGNEIEQRRLTKLRDNILQTMDDLDKQSREMLAQAAAFLREAISQPAPEAFLRDNVKRLDEAFFAVLNANIGEAQRRQDEKSAKALAALGAIAVKILQESAPPEIRLINEAVQAEPEQRRALLEGRRDLLTHKVVGLIDQMAASLRGGNAALAKELAQVRDLIEEIRKESQTT